MDGFVRLGGSDDHLTASLDSGSPLSVLGNYSVFPSLQCLFLGAAGGGGCNIGNPGCVRPHNGVRRHEHLQYRIRRDHEGERAGAGVRVRARNAGGGDNAGEISTNFSVSDGSWHHVVAVFEAGSRSVASSMESSKGINSTPIAITTNPIQYFTVGAFRRAGNTLDDFKGDVDDLQIYSGALTAGDAFQLYSVPGSVVTTSSGVDDIALVDLVDPLIGAIDTGSCVPGPVLPHSSIYPSSDTAAAAAGGFKSGSNVVGFSQVHASGSGSSTMSYGNFLLSPDTGGTIRINESDHGSPITNVTARPYSYRGTLGTWNTNCTIAAAALGAIYRFEVSRHDDRASLHGRGPQAEQEQRADQRLDRHRPRTGNDQRRRHIQRKLEPRVLQSLLLREVDKTPTSGGTFVGNTIQDGTLSASIGSSAQRRWRMGDSKHDPIANRAGENCHLVRFSEPGEGVPRKRDSRVGSRRDRDCGEESLEHRTRRRTYAGAFLSTRAENYTPRSITASSSRVTARATPRAGRPRRSSGTTTTRRGTCGRRSFRCSRSCSHRRLHRS